MKISVISKEKTWHTEKLEEEAKKSGVELEVVDLIDLEHGIDGLGDVVFWRSASVSKTSGRAAALSRIKESGRLIFNQGVSEFPFVTHKLFQQKFTESVQKINNIDTFIFKDKDELLDATWSGVLKFPFIKKPDLGARGEGVEKIDSKEELEEKEIDFSKSIFQNFVKNDGDFRVLVLGGRPLGAMKRVAKEGEFLNNFSKGGSCFVVEDEIVKEQLYEIATKVATRFKLAFCGVDIIFDQDEKKYKFLELNTVAQWEGFQGATKVNVAKEIIDFFGEMHKRGKVETRQLVQDYYQKNLKKLNFDKSFHFLSRMFLWEKDEAFVKGLEERESKFIGIDEGDIRATFAKALSDENKFKNIVINGFEQREKHVEKYPSLGSYNRILFQALLSKSVYGKDVSGLVGEILDQEVIVEMREGLLNDPVALKSLSTHAINYLYFLQEIFPGKFDVDPAELFKIAKYGFDNESESLLLKIYFLTHCIIGESRFYAQKIDDKSGVYTEMLRFLEDVIRENYFDVSLDNKVEFLVCARMCNFTSSLKTMILDEAERSFSEIGNFLVDTLNEKRTNPSKRDFYVSEHRNVLYLMATSDKYIFDKKEDGE